VKRVPFLLFIILFAGISTAGVKYVAVVETDVDIHSGASAQLNSADVRQVTAELRREAVKNLPRGQYNIMTTETVYSQGSAVLEECADENCVIALGSKIGADFIVRGTVSKLETMFTLIVEMYETMDGTLVASSDPVRYESIRALIENAGAACADMYKSFANSQSALQKQQAAPDTAGRQPEEKTVPEFKSEPEESPSTKLSVGVGAFFANDFGGGLNWGGGVQVTIPYSGGGAYIFFDAAYVEAFISFSGGGGKWESGNVSISDTTILPDMSRSYMNIGVFAKYPVAVGSIKMFPLLGIDYEMALSVKLNADGYEYPFDGNDKHPAASDINALWFKFGGGADAALSQRLYLRAELLYGFRGTNKFEDDKSVDNSANVKTAGGLTVRVGMGINL
jgi:hypothetical protein